MKWLATLLPYLAVLARADQGLLAPVLGHMAADFTILMAVYLRATGTV